MTNAFVCSPVHCKPKVYIFAFSSLITGADPRGSFGSEGPFHSVSYSKVSISINYFTGTV